MSGSAFQFVCPLRECNHETGPIVFDVEEAQRGFVKHLISAPTHPDGRMQVALEAYLREQHGWLKTFTLEAVPGPR